MRKAVMGWTTHLSDRISLAPELDNLARWDGGWPTKKNTRSLFRGMRTNEPLIIMRRLIRHLCALMHSSVPVGIKRLTEAFGREDCEADVSVLQYQTMSPRQWWGTVTWETKNYCHNASEREQQQRYCHICLQDGTVPTMDYSVVTPISKRARSAG